MVSGNREVLVFDCKSGVMGVMGKLKAKLASTVVKVRIVSGVVFPGGAPACDH